MSNDIKVQINGDQGRVDEVVKRLLALPDYRMKYVDLDHALDDKNQVTVTVSLINEGSKVCHDCDYFDYRQEDPEARCRVGLSCRNATTACPYYSTNVLDRKFGSVDRDEDDIAQGIFWM